MPELMDDDDRNGDDSGKRVYCTWCTLPFLSQEDNRKILEGMVYHDVCFDQLEAWWRANSAREQQQKQQQQKQKPHGE